MVKHRPSSRELSRLGRRTQRELSSGASLLQFRGFVKKTAMLGGGITVGHPGDVIADTSRPASFASACPSGGLRPFGGHPIRDCEKPGKKIANDQSRLLANTDEALVPVHVC